MVSAGDTCHALVMSGGGSNGAWEAGVLWGLVHYGNPDEYKWDVVSGVSAGSINSAAMGVWAPGDEVKGTEWLVDTWGNLETGHIYSKYPFGILPALFNMPSLYDTRPGRETLQKILAAYPDGFKRKVAVSAVDANTGEKVTMTDEDVDFKDFHIAVLGSASVPGAFPPTHLKYTDKDGKAQDHLFMDGMTAYNTDVQASIDRCR